VGYSTIDSLGLSDQLQPGQSLQLDPLDSIPEQMTFYKGSPNGW